VKRSATIGVLATVVIVVVGATPFAVRRMDFFRVRQIEVVGLRYLQHRTVLDELGLEENRNLFDANGDMLARANALPGVVSARAERHLPGTLRLIFEERVPVAFAISDRRLIALDADGRPLPYDPAASELDLPIVGVGGAPVVQVLSVVRAADSLLYGATDAAYTVESA